MVICGAVIYLAVFLILTSVSFWFEDRVGIVPPVFNMLTFGRYPLTIYNVFIQFLLSWIIPFAFASFYPTTHFLGRRAFTPYFHLVPVVAAGFFLLAHRCLEQGRGELQQHGIVIIAEKRRLVMPPQGRLRSKGERRRGHLAAVTPDDG